MKTTTMLLVLVMLTGVLVCGCAMEDDHDHGGGPSMGATVCPKCGGKLDDKGYCARCQQYIGDMAE